MYKLCYLKDEEEDVEDDPLLGVEEGIEEVEVWYVKNKWIDLTKR